MPDVAVQYRAVARLRIRPGVPTQRRLIGSSTAPAPFRVISVVALDSTHVRITFAEPMLSNPPLRTASSYEITGIGAAAGHNPRVLTATPQAVAAPISVDLTTDEMRGGIDNYNMRIHSLEEA